MSLPNLLTVWRFPAAVLFLAWYLATGQGGFLEGAMPTWVVFLVLLLLTGAAEISDILDGRLARSRGQVSNLGKILDPYADATYHLTVLFCFASDAWGTWVPLWMVMVTYYREAVVHVVRSLGQEQGLYIHAHWTGKAKTTALGIASVVILLWATVRSAMGLSGPAFGEEMTLVSLPFMWIILLFSLWSGTGYAWRNRALFAGLKAR
ncbi:MAG: CDP-alcohol phosphatidyltransferase family protein [Deltaproteobacteria bacterium]|nr:CDP-alcohol phosphatidyltransferase family protein [Deltaproteobacteria bacterium]